MAETASTISQEGPATRRLRTLDRGPAGFDEQSGLQQVGWFAAVLWVCLYMSDIRILWDRPLHLIVAPILVGASWPCFQGFSRRVLLLGSVLSTLWVYQGMVSLDFQWRNLAELMLATYFFSLSPFRSRWGLRWLAIALGAYFAISFLLFLATVFSPSIRDGRTWLYLRSEKTLASLENVALTEEAMTVQQGGLTPYLHLFGYQISAGVALFLALATLRRGLGAWIWYLPTAIGIVTLFLAGQRSAFLGFFVACVAVILLLRRFRMAAVLLVAIALISFVVIQTNSGVTDLREYNVVDRLQSGESDFGSRLALQWWALGQVVEHPFGLLGADIDYFDIAPELLGTRVVAPHNGYITRLLLFGWPVGVLTIVMFGMLFSMGRASWKRYDASSEAAVEWTALLGLLGAMANALFHNASFATFNPETLVLLLFYASCFVQRNIAVAATLTADAPREIQRNPGRPFSPLARFSRSRDVRPHAT